MTGRVNKWNIQYHLFGLHEEAQDFDLIGLTNVTMRVGAISTTR